ncbi:MAG: hypothetical protein WC371_01450 [Parachlamydiales bacterium]|jgi:hypothetical protein
MSDLKKIDWNTLLGYFSHVQSKVSSQLASLAANTSTTAPGQFLMMQFQMASVTQMGDSISNMISQFNAMINNAVRNMGK